MKKDIWFYWPNRKTHLMIARFHEFTHWQVGILGLEIDHIQPRELFITTWGPILERPFMLWLRWPLWGKSPKGVVLWRRYD